MCQNVARVFTSAASLIACLFAASTSSSARGKERGGESSCCRCPSLSGQVELMHYLKALTLSPSHPLASRSLKLQGEATAGQRSHAQWRRGGPRPTDPTAATSLPVTPAAHKGIKHAHNTANTQPHTLCSETNTHTHTCRHTLVFCSQPSLNSFPCILQLGCHSSPQRYQSLSPRPHNGSSWVAAASVAPAISKF